MTHRPTQQDAKRPGDMEDEEAYKNFVVGSPQDALTREVAINAPKDMPNPHRKFVNPSMLHPMYPPPPMTVCLTP